MINGSGQVLNLRSEQRPEQHHLALMDGLAAGDSEKLDPTLGGHVGQDIFRTSR